MPRGIAHGVTNLSRVLWPTKAEPAEVAIAITDRSELNKTLFNKQRDASKDIDGQLTTNAAIAVPIAKSGKRHLFQISALLLAEQVSVRAHSQYYRTIPVFDSIRIMCLQRKFVLGRT